MIRGIPVLVPPVNLYDPTAVIGTRQPIMVFKELEPDLVRYQAWKSMVLRLRVKRKAAK